MPPVAEATRAPSMVPRRMSRMAQLPEAARVGKLAQVAQVAQAARTHAWMSGPMLGQTLAPT